MARQRNQLRIIGGDFRGRRLNFPDGRGLRPTADRVRETLFNWLQGQVRGRRVLDLFAGSGALGIEALSRGAAEVIFVEQARVAAAKLRENLALLEVGAAADVVQADALRWLAGPRAPFDLVFLDPPFAAGLLGNACELLESGGTLAPHAWIYLEQDAAQEWPPTPANWSAHREGRAGQAAFRLMDRNG